MRVEVYWNVRRRIFSVRALSGPMKGRLLQHAATVFLTDATFVAQTAGRNKVRATGQKNVHAFVRGTIGEVSTRHAFREAITYNPMKHESFVYVLTGKPIYSAPFCYLTRTESHSPNIFA